MTNEELRKWAEEKADEIYDGTRYWNNADYSGTMKRKIADALMEAAQVETVELHRARILLWATHGCTEKYGDDGELQCNSCKIDFKRNSISDIDAKICERGVRILVEEKAGEKV